MLLMRTFVERLFLAVRHCIIIIINVAIGNIHTKASKSNPQSIGCKEQLSRGQTTLYRVLS